MSLTTRAAVRRAIERPEAVLLIRLQNISSGTQVAIANLHVTWSQLKFPALQALQVNMLHQYFKIKTITYLI